MSRPVEAHGRPLLSDGSSWPRLAVLLASPCFRTSVVCGGHWAWVESLKVVYGGDGQRGVVN